MAIAMAMAIGVARVSLHVIKPQALGSGFESVAEAVAFSEEACRI